MELTDEQLELVAGGFGDVNLGLNLQTITTGPNVSILNAGSVFQNSGANSQKAENSILDNNGVIKNIGGLGV